MTPKEDFIQSEHAKAHLDLCATKHFREACKAALLQFIDELPKTGDVSKGWDNHSRLQGALRFREIFENLSLPVKTEKQAAGSKLNYDAYDRPTSR